MLRQELLQQPLDFSHNERCCDAENTPNLLGKRMISRYQLINWVKEAPVEWQELSNERAAYEELNRKLKQQGLLLTGHQRLGTPTFVGLVIGGWRQSGLVTTGVQEQFAQDLKILRKGCDRGYCSIVLAFAGLDLQEEAAERALQRPMWENLTELVKDICKIPSGKLT